MVNAKICWPSIVTAKIDQIRDSMGWQVPRVINRSFGARNWNRFKQKFPNLRKVSPFVFEYGIRNQGTEGFGFDINIQVPDGRAYLSVDIVREDIIEVTLLSGQSDPHARTYWSDGNLIPVLTRLNDELTRQQEIDPKTRSNIEALLTNTPVVRPGYSFPFYQTRVVGREQVSSFLETLFKIAEPFARRPEQYIP